MPMASEEERRDEAPGLRVGRGAWKWPPVWPYANNEFVRKDEIIEAQPNGNGLSSMMGMQQTTEDDGEETEVKVLNVLDYWGKEKEGIKTEIDEEAVLQLKKYVQNLFTQNIFECLYHRLSCSFLP